MVRSSRSEINLVEQISLFHQYCIRDVVIILSLLVNHSFGSYLYNPVTDSLNKLMVMRGHEDISFELYQSIIKCLNGLKIQMICRSIKKHNIGISNHHTRYHASDFFSS